MSNVGYLKRSIQAPPPNRIPEYRCIGEGIYIKQGAQPAPQLVAARLEAHWACRRLGQRPTGHAPGTPCGASTR